MLRCMLRRVDQPLGGCGMSPGWGDSERARGSARHNQVGRIVRLLELRIIGRAYDFRRLEERILSNRISEVRRPFWAHRATIARRKVPIN